MSVTLPDDPKLSIAVIMLENVMMEMKDNPDEDYIDITTHRDQVFGRYQPLFKPEKIRELSKADFRSFLLYKNNHHWNGLNRIGTQITKDMMCSMMRFGFCLTKPDPFKSGSMNCGRKKIGGSMQWFLFLGCLY